MGLKFGDLLSNALHEVKLHTRKKIGIIQDEIGYTFDPALTGVTIESWRYRKPPSALLDLEQLATAIIDYGCSVHDVEWLSTFLASGGHPFPEVVCQRLFPTSNPELPTTDYQPPVTEYQHPPISAYSPPKLDTFIGRQAELSRFQTELANNNIALICGMAGMGKTTLANRLANLIDDQETVFWHPFHDGNLNPFVRRLAGFLANHGRADLWEMIESARLAGVKPPDIETSFDTLVAQLDQSNVTLCLDDLQYVDDDPEFADFMTRIQKGGVKLIITARRFPSFINSRLIELDGLSPADAGELLQARDVELADDLIAELHSHTAGNGAFLTLSAVMLHNAANPADLIAKLSTIDNIERFLMEEVNDRLSANQQRVMEGVAILGGYPGTRDALEEILNQRDVRRTLQELSGQFLLLVGEGEFGREYSQHSIIQAFYYEQPRQRIRRDLHLRAAEFYELEEVDRFKATLHYAKGDHSERATLLASAHLWEIVNQGMAKPLADILDGIQEGNLAQNDLFELWLAQAQLDTLLGDVDNAQEVLQKAAERLQELPTTNETNILKGRVCLHMAELLERQSPPDALTWAQRGLDIVPREEVELTAALTIRAGTMMMHMGNLGGALETFETVEAEKLENNIALHSDLLMNLSGTHIHLGQLDQALAYTNEALEQSKQQRNHFQSCGIMSNLALIYYLDGNWGKATEVMEEAIGVAQRLGSRREEIPLSVNLAGIYSYLGNYELAWHHINKVINLNEGQITQETVVTKINMGRLLIEEKSYQSAFDILVEAKAIAETKNDQINLSLAQTYQAEALLGKSDFHEAEQSIDQSIKNLTSLGDSHSLGIALRIKGQIATAKREFESADALFKRSLDLLKGLDFFQEALTKAHYGRLKIECSDLKHGEQLLEQATSTFLQVGADHKAIWLEKSFHS